MRCYKKENNIFWDKMLQERAPRISWMEKMHEKSPLDELKWRRRRKKKLAPQLYRAEKLAFLDRVKWRYGLGGTTVKDMVHTKQEEKRAAGKEEPGSTSSLPLLIHWSSHHGLRTRQVLISCHDGQRSTFRMPHEEHQGRPSARPEKVGPRFWPNLDIQ